MTNWNMGLLSWFSFCYTAETMAVELRALKSKQVLGEQRGHERRAFQEREMAVNLLEDWRVEPALGIEKGQIPNGLCISDRALRFARR